MRTRTNSASYTLADLAARVGAQVDGDGTVEITGAAPVERAKTGDISFVANRRYFKYLEKTEASAVVLDIATPFIRTSVIRHNNPYLTFARIVDILYPDTPYGNPGVHQDAFVDKTAQVAATAFIGPLCHVGAGSSVGENSQIVSSVYIGRNVSIGSNCLIHPGVKILDDTLIGNNVILQAGAVLGSDGFGYAESETGLKKIKQIGWVEVGDDVEIGANTTVDRGALGPTRIGKGTKIDNLVQIAHNVELGQHCIIVSQVGIAGSTKLGNGVILAGQVGVIGHLEIGDGVQIGAQSGIKKDIPAGKTYLGSPAREVMEAKRIEASISRLPELFKRVKKLEDSSEK